MRMEFTLGKKRFVKSNARHGHKTHLRTQAKVKMRGEDDQYTGWYLLCKGMPPDADLIGFDHSWDPVSKHFNVDCRKCLEALGRILVNNEG